MADRRRRNRRQAIIFGAARPVRPLRDFQNPLEALGGDEELIRSHFRLYSRAIMFVCGLVGPMIRREMVYGLPVLLQVCVTLKFLGSGSYFINVGGQRILDISTASSWRCVDGVGRALAGQLARFVVFPRGAALQRCQTRFREIGRIGARQGE